MEADQNDIAYEDFEFNPWDRWDFLYYVTQKKVFVLCDAEEGVM
jgi:hypothetical protein